MPSRIRALAALLLLLAPSGARAGSAAADPLFEWSFWRYHSDGAGGFDDAFVLFENSQVGAQRREGVLLAPGSPHVEIYFTEHAAEVWTSARSPRPAVLTIGTTIGGGAGLSVTRRFRKDAPGAALAFEIPDGELSVSGGPTGNEGLRAAVRFEVAAGDFFAFAEETVLAGNAGAWTLASGAGELPWEIASGGHADPAVTYVFASPFARQIDLGSVPLGGEFDVTYRVLTEAIDTVQAGTSGATAFARDPANDADGISFETSGLTPVPEAGQAPMLLAGGALLAARRARRTAPA